MTQREFSEKYKVNYNDVGDAIKMGHLDPGCSESDIAYCLVEFYVNRSNKLLERAWAWSEKARTVYEAVKLEGRNDRASV